jgi:hypothetical protein
VRSLHVTSREEPSALSRDLFHSGGILGEATGGGKNSGGMVCEIFRVKIALLQ